MLDFWVLIIGDANDPQRIVSAYSPDFNEELLNGTPVAEFHEENEQNHNYYRNFIVRILETKLRDNISFIEPLSYKELPNNQLSWRQRWEYFEIAEPQAKLCSFARILPVVGKFATFVSIFIGIAATFATMTLTFSNHNNNNHHENRIKLYILSGCSALFNGLFEITIYLNTNVLQNLKLLGHLLDNLCMFNCKNSTQQISTHRSSNEIWYVCLSTLAIGCVILNACLNILTQRQELILLTHQFLKRYPELSEKQYQFYYQLIMLCVIYPGMITTAYSMVTLQGSLAFKIIQGCRSRYHNRASVTNPINQPLLFSANNAAHHNSQPTLETTNMPSPLNRTIE